jgi:protein SCO1/2
MGRVRALWVVIGVVVLVALAGAMVPRPTSGQPAKPKLIGTILQGKPAPAFRLNDQFGRTVSLSQFRGRTVVLTFIESHCTTLCPVVADKLHRLDMGLGTSRNRVAILGISTDPEGDTYASMRSFSRKHGLLHSWHFLVAGRAQLAPIWRGYYIYAAPKAASPTLDSNHTSATYLIDGSGRERVLFGGDPNTNALNRDVRILAGIPSGQLRSSIPAPQAGHPAPTFDLPMLNGGRLSLHSLRGKVVLINFWATWCKPCKSEMPRLAGWYRQYSSHGLVVIGIDQQEDAASVRAFTQKLRTPYRIALDQTGNISAQYDVAYLPVSVLVDPRGYIRSVHLGILSQSFLSGQVDPVLRSSA